MSLYHIFALLWSQIGVAVMFSHRSKMRAYIIHITTIDRDRAKLDNCNNYEK